MMSLRTEGSATRTGILVPSMNWRAGEPALEIVLRPDNIGLAQRFGIRVPDDPAVRRNTPPSMGPTELTWRLWQAAQWSAKSCCPRGGSGSDEAARRESSLPFSGVS